MIGTFILTLLTICAIVYALSKWKETSRARYVRELRENEDRIREKYCKCLIQQEEMVANMYEQYGEIEIARNHRDIAYRILHYREDKSKEKKAWRDEYYDEDGVLNFEFSAHLSPSKGSIT